MKKALSLLLLISVFAVGCGKEKKKKETKKNNKSMNMPLAQDQDSKKGFFDNEVEGFVLDDFPANDSLTVANNDQAISWVSESEDKNKGFVPVHFDFDRSKVRVDQQPILEQDIKQAKKAIGQGESVVVEGHSCHSAGSKTYNLLLSELRGQEVAKRMVEEGINPENIKVVGRGNEMPVVLHGDRDQQAPNRRVEFLTLHS